jgi:hypothetical protein
MRRANSPIGIFVGDVNDYDGGQAPCEALIREFAPADAAYLRCTLLLARRMISTLDGANFSIQTAIAAKAESFMSGPIRKRASRRATISRHSLPPHCGNNRA